MKIIKENCILKLINVQKKEDFENLPSFYFASNLINKIQFQNMITEKEICFSSDSQSLKYIISSIIEDYLSNEENYLDLKNRTQKYYFEQLGANQL